jgi:hypothetical protein
MKGALMSNTPDAVMPDAGAETGDLQTAAAWDAYTQAGVSDSLAASAEAGAGIATDAALTEAVGLLEAAASDDALSVSEDPLATPDELWGASDAVDDPNADVAAMDQSESDADSHEHNRPDYEFLSNTMADMSHQTVESWTKWGK